MLFNNSRKIISDAVKKANTMFNPSFNQNAEELSGEPNDRTAYDYAGTEMEQVTPENDEELGEDIISNI